MKLFTFVVLAAVSMTVFLAEDAYAIPAFARKYKTSCQTCHNGFPKLNAFGEAFRRNGYQFPGGTDPEFVKEDPVSLGSEGNKKAFPDAIWPGTLPGSSPISLFLNGEIDYNPKEDPVAYPDGTPRWTFGGLGNSVEAVAAGTLGEDLSFWSQVSFSTEGLELNRIFLIFSNVIGDKYAFNIRAGVIEPGMFSFSTHRAWMEGYWLTTRAFSDDMGWTIEETQKGLEVNGMAGGRFAYSAGVVEGFGGLHSDKDYYGHVAYKFSGLPLDGVTEGGPAPNNPQPYIDNSLTIGGYVYHGTADISNEALGSASNAFTMAGGDINAYYDRFNLFGGVGLRHDEQPFLDAPGTGANTTVWFTELDVVAYPWLLPSVRYESWQSDNSDLSSYTSEQFVPGVVFLVRPNVKFTLRTSIWKDSRSADPKYDFGQVSLAMAVGM